MYEMQGPHRGPSHAADLLIAQRSQLLTGPASRLQNPRSTRLPGLHAPFELPLRGPRHQVVNEFLLPQTGGAQGLSTKHFKILFWLHKKPAVIPRGRGLSTKYPQGCSQPGGSSLRSLPRRAQYAKRRSGRGTLAVVAHGHRCSLGASTHFPWPASTCTAVPMRAASHTPWPRPSNG